MIATARQTSFINSLLAKKDISNDEFRSIELLLEIDGFTKQRASETIDWLLSKPTISRKPVEVPEGMHRVGSDIYKVQRAVHGSGNLYAKKLVLDINEDGELVHFGFEYARGAIRLLSDDTAMTLEEAKSFGALYGTCVVCGRTLTDENSIADGIGPVCARKF